VGVRREREDDRRQRLPRDLESPVPGATATASGGRGSRVGGEAAMGGGNLRMVERSRRWGIRWPRGGGRAEGGGGEQKCQRQRGTRRRGQQEGLGRSWAKE
jgi:hypothetical protein